MDGSVSPKCGFLISIPTPEVKNTDVIHNSMGKVNEGHFASKLDSKRRDGEEEGKEDRRGRSKSMYCDVHGTITPNGRDSDNQAATTSSLKNNILKYVQKHIFTPDTTCRKTVGAEGCELVSTTRFILANVPRGEYSQTVVASGHFVHVCSFGGN